MLVGEHSAAKGILEAGFDSFHGSLPPFGCPVSIHSAGRRRGFPLAEDIVQLSRFCRRSEETHPSVTSFAS